MGDFPIIPQHDTSRNPSHFFLFFYPSLSLSFSLFFFFKGYFCRLTFGYYTKLNISFICVFVKRKEDDSIVRGKMRHYS